MKISYPSFRKGESKNRIAKIKGVSRATVRNAVKWALENKPKAEVA